MAIRVLHRKDQLLQRNNAEDHSGEGHAQAQAARAHQALEKFVD